MKKLVILLFTIPALTFGQVPKGANKIIISNDASKDQNMKHVIQTLIEAGYTIYKSDLEYGTIQTDEIPSARKQPLHKFNFVIKDKSIQVSGYAKTGIGLVFSGVTVSDDWFQIENKGMKGSTQMQVFLIMDEFSRKLIGSISYLP